MSTIVAFNPVEYQDKRRAKSQENAILALTFAPNNVFPVAFGFEGDKPHPLVKELNITTLNILKKDSSKLIGNNRRLPYINEIMDCCCKIDCEVFGYINSDILLNRNVYNTLEPMPYDAYIFERFEVAEFNDIKEVVNCKSFPKKIYGGDKHEGNDAFFFWKKWYLWKKSIFDKYPLIIGETEWDTCYRILIKNTADYIFEDRRLYHVYHDAKWTLDSEGAKHNIAMLKEIQRLEDLDELNKL
jgi:hypothetical protein